MSKSDFSPVSKQLLQGVVAVQQSVVAHLTPESREAILGPMLRRLYTHGTGKTLIGLALYADALRLVHDAIFADGSASDEELEAASTFLVTVAQAFSKVRTEYASYAHLSPEQLHEFLDRYQNDKGFFGYRNESTKWSSVEVCRAVAHRFHDDAALSQLQQVFLESAEQLLAADGTSHEERQFPFGSVDRCSIQLS